MHVDSKNRDNFIKNLMLIADHYSIQQLAFEVHLYAIARHGSVRLIL